MMAAHSDNMLRFILPVLVCMVNSCSSVPVNHEDNIGNSYKRVVELEDRYLELRENWDETKTQQVGNSPESMQRNAIVDVGYLIDQALAKVSRDGSITQRDRKQFYLRLMKEHGVAITVRDTGLFTERELRHLVDVKGYKATALYRRTYK